MEKLSDELKLFILDQLEKGNYRLDDGDLIITLISKPKPNLQNIYKLASGKWNVKIHNPKTKKKINVGTFNSMEEARVERGRAQTLLTKSEVIIILHSFRNNK